MPQPERKRWIQDEIAKLRAMHARGATFDEIARAVGHPIDSCKWMASQQGCTRRHSRRNDIGVPRGSRGNTGIAFGGGRMSTAARAKATRRPCMNDRCRKLFWSEGAHNRLCPSCRRQEGDTVFTMPATVIR